MCYIIYLVDSPFWHHPKILADKYNERYDYIPSTERSSHKLLQWYKD